jgi:uncharacterized protein (DUF2141 family)
MMNMVLRRITVHAASIIFMCITGCGTGKNPVQAGSETTSGVEITAQGNTINARTAPHATIALFDARYLFNDTIKVIADSGISNDSGKISFSNLPSGTYNLFVYPNDAVKGAAVLGISIKENSRDVVADTQVFTPLRTIQGTLTRQEMPISGSAVFIRGSSFHSLTDQSGQFTFVGVPAGTYLIKATRIIKNGPVVDSVAVEVPENGNEPVAVQFQMD